jgi:hypothetical protein
LSGDADSTALQVGKGYLQALTFVAEPVLRRHPQVVEGDFAGIGSALAELRFKAQDGADCNIGRRDEG